MTQEMQVFILLRDGDTVCINFQRIPLPPHHFLNKPLKRSHFLQLNFLEEISRITHLFMYLILETFRGFLCFLSVWEVSFPSRWRWFFSFVFFLAWWGGTKLGSIRGRLTSLSFLLPGSITNNLAAFLIIHSLILNVIVAAGRDKAQRRSISDGAASATGAADWQPIDAGGFQCSGKKKKKKDIYLYYFKLARA